MAEGTVVKYNEKTGTGLAKQDDGGKEIFVHRDYLKDRAGKGLEPIPVEGDMPINRSSTRSVPRRFMDEPQTQDHGPEGP